jgi:hypothetical protein
VRPVEVLDLFDRLVRAWRTARARGLNNLAFLSWPQSSTAKEPCRPSGYPACVLGLCGSNPTMNDLQATLADHSGHGRWPGPSS